MLKAKLALIIGNCRRHAWSVIALAVLLAVVSGVYASRHFAIDTDINRLISPDLPWRQQELAFSRAFPQRNGTIFAVVDAPTAGLASRASAALAERLSGQEDLFRSVDSVRSRRRFQMRGSAMPCQTSYERRPFGCDSPRRQA
jgi:predicted RND superfamily exporter protein